MNKLTDLVETKERIVNGMRVDMIEERYKARYVGYYDLPNREGPFLVFYTETPNRDQGHDNYFAIWRNFIDNNDIRILSAASIRKATFPAIEVKPGKFLVSRSVHDYVTTPQGAMLDGGPFYTRYNPQFPPTHNMYVIDGREVFMPVVSRSITNGMTGILGDVAAFHHACDQPVHPYPNFPDQARIDLRYRLIHEEWTEYQEAVAERNLAKVADALADMVYVIAGTALEFGIPLDKVWEAVQNSNMKKLDPTTGKAIKREDGKILKPEGWQPPDAEIEAALGISAPSLSIESVKDFVAEAHAGQTYAGRPFTYHLDKVHRALVEFGYNSFTYQASALLHDVMEDTPVTFDEVKERFGLDVAEMAFAVSGFGANRKERNADIKVKIARLPTSAPVKGADRFINHATSICSPDTNQPDKGKMKMYLAEKEDFLTMVKPHINAKMFESLEIQYTAMERLLNEVPAP